MTKYFSGFPNIYIRVTFTPIQGHEGHWSYKTMEPSVKWAGWPQINIIITFNKHVYVLHELTFPAGQGHWEMLGWHSIWGTPFLKVFFWCRQAFNVAYYTYISRQLRHYFYRDDLQWRSRSKLKTIKLSFLSWKVIGIIFCNLSSSVSLFWRIDLGWPSKVKVTHYPSIINCW